MVAQMLPQRAFQPAPMQPPGGAVASMSLDPMQLLDALQQLAPARAALKPRYPAGYKKPTKPEPGKVKVRADQLFNDASEWRALIAVTEMWIRHERTGMFDEDREDRRRGLQEEFISTNLTTKRNAVIAKVADAEMAITKRYYDNEQRQKSQMIEDASDWMMSEFAFQHMTKGQRALRLDEALLYADRGMYCSRQCFDQDDPDFPINIDLIEPTEVYPVWGGKRGLLEVYRVRRDTLEHAAADYSDFTKSVWDTLKKKYGNDRTDNTEINIYEFHDTWHKIVMVDDQPIISTPHEYGYVPWTIQYGGYGSAMFTRTPLGDAVRNSNGNFYDVNNTRISERAYKAVPLLFYDLRSHEMLEAIMGRLVTGFKREVNPPMERYRSTLLHGTDMPEYSQAPGAQNEMALGEEESKVSPQLANSPITGMIVQTLMGENAQRSVGINDKAGQSNNSGAALSRFQDANNDHLMPIFKSLEAAKTHQITQLLTTLGNWQELTKYGGERTKPLMIPARRTSGIGPGFELSRELIDEVGPRVEVIFSYVDPERWVNIFNAGKIGIELGAITRAEIRQEATGKTDYESHMERWIQETAVMNMSQHPKFNEMFLIPGQLQGLLDEARKANDPEMVKFWQKQIDDWKQMAMAQPQPMQGMGGGSGGAGSMPQGQAGPQGNPMAPGPQVAAPPVGANGTLPSAVGPGSQGAPVGRPY